MAISARPFFKFNESISFMVHFEAQEEIDYLLEKLSAAPEAEQCGWLKDRYGVSWQIVPAVMTGMMQDFNLERLTRAIQQAFLHLKKFDFAALQKAYSGNQRVLTMPELFLLPLK
jgi:predicted 3-demethylubiquinone-9 3-methyltransferase (glyoxalase superfamily)